MSTARRSTSWFSRGTSRQCTGWMGRSCGTTMRGRPVEMLLLGPDRSVEQPVLGDDLAAGERPCVVVPAHTWMGAATRGEWSLMGTTMAPPYHHDGFELGDGDELARQYPSAAAEIAGLVRP